MKKMKNKKIAGIFFISIFILCFLLAFVNADEIRMPMGNEISPLVRGESRGILMDPDTMYTLYYISDGKPATLQYSQPFLAYFVEKMPVVAMSIYYAPWVDKKYTSVKNTGIDFIPKKISLPQKEGLYKFEFKTYGNWDAVTFKVLY